MLGLARWCSVRLRAPKAGGILVGEQRSCQATGRLGIIQCWKDVFNKRKQCRWSSADHASVCVATTTCFMRKRVCFLLKRKRWSLSHLGKSFSRIKKKNNELFAFIYWSHTVMWEKWKRIRLLIISIVFPPSSNQSNESNLTKSSCHHQEGPMWELCPLSEWDFNIPLFITAHF